MRIIYVDVCGFELKLSSKSGGVQGEQNVTVLQIRFDESWTGLGKRIIWRDATGENPVPVVLFDPVGADGDILSYATAIPAAALAYPGWCSFTVEGCTVKNGNWIKAMGAVGSLEVRASEVIYQPEDETPSQTQQILAALGSTEQTVAGSAEEAKSWAVGGTNSREGEDTDNARFYAGKASESAEQAAAAKTAAQTAKNAAESAKTGAESAAAQAGQSAAAAQEAKSAAETAAATAQTAKSGAESAKTAALVALGAAETAKTAAETAAAQTAESKTIAETAKAEAQTARAGAESALEAAETAKTGAEAAAATAQTAKSGAVDAKDDAVSAKNAALSARDDAQQAAEEVVGLMNTLEVTATGLPPGNMATAAYDPETKTVTFGIPAGQKGDMGPKGDKGDTGAAGAKGDTGQGVLAGGTAGQFLCKKSGADYDTQWVTVTDGNGVYY